MSVDWKPAGMRSITPYLIVRGGDAALSFYEKAFGAKVTVRMPGENGRLDHAEFHIGDSILMLADELAELGMRSPLSVGGGSVSFMIYVPDCDAVYSAALAAGATVIRPLADQFYGDRSGLVLDPFGHSWNIATHKEDVSAEEMKKRAAEAFGSAAG
jgi:PhnB protein